MYKYTLCFIRRGTQLLMLNRYKPPEMGVWNGVGGKIKAGETPEQCVLREVLEETNLRLEKVAFAGSVTWIHAAKGTSGMHVFFGDLDEEYEYPTPVSVEEGILDWKEISWILDPYNHGISNAVHEFLPLMIAGSVLDHRYTMDDRGIALSCERLSLEGVPL